MADIFQEVDDDLRREKLEQFWKENGNFIITLIILVVLSTAATSAWRSWSTNRNYERTTGLLEAVYAGDQDKQADALGAYIVEHDGFHGTLARFVAADKMIAKGETEEAVKLYDQVAADGDVDDLYRGLARLMSISARLDDGDAATLTRDIDVLDRKGNPWQLAAQEMRALLASREGDPATAAKLMNALRDNEEAPTSMRARAEALAGVYTSQAALAANAAATQPESGDAAGTQQSGAVTE